MGSGPQDGSWGSNEGPWIDFLRTGAITCNKHRSQAAEAGCGLPGAMAGTNLAKCCQRGGKWGEKNVNNRTGNCSQLTVGPGK